MACTIKLLPRNLLAFRFKIRSIFTFVFFQRCFCQSLLVGLRSLIIEKPWMWRVSKKIRFFLVDTLHREFWVFICNRKITLHLWKLFFWIATSCVAALRFLFRTLAITVCEEVVLHLKLKRNTVKPVIEGHGLLFFNLLAGMTFYYRWPSIFQAPR